MNHEDALDLFREELDILLNKAHNAGIYYQELLGECIKKCETLNLQDETEYLVKGGK